MLKTGKANLILGIFCLIDAIVIAALWFFTDFIDNQTILASPTLLIVSAWFTYQGIKMKKEGK